MLSQQIQKITRRFQTRIQPVTCPADSRPLTNISKGGARGQALILLAISFFALLAFIGLVTDVGSIYVSYTQLQRAIDAAAVAGANNIKYPQASYAERKQKITESALEILDLHDITGISDLEVYLCSDTGLPAEFNPICTGGDPRKLVYIRATQQSPVYFLHIFGVQSVPLTTYAIGEAAALDMVLVFDTSESMGKDTPGYNYGRNFDPSACNTTNTCQPLRQAKDAAKSLTNNLFTGYDRVALVTFDFDAQVEYNLSDDLGQVNNAIDNLIQLHDDPPSELLPWVDASPWGGYRIFNPIYPDDRDGDGFDNDPGAVCTDNFINLPGGTLGAAGRDLWDDNTGDPCDRDDILDAYDWNDNGDHDDDDINPPTGPLNAGANIYEGTSLLSTCSGCGIRMATNVLKNGGRATAVWVIVFLSDGIANMSDTPYSFNGGVPNSFRYGFCGPTGGASFWPSYCIDPNPGTFDPDLGTHGLFVNRNCIDSDSDECPPGATHVTTSGPFSVDDYALDMVDTAALLESSNPNEPRGEDIIIYSIGLGAASAGETLLRYMANVGDDGSRLNDECDGIATQQHCGNYYYAPSGPYLSQIFESIAGRIFTKISR